MSTLPAKSFEEWLDLHMVSGTRAIPARLLTLVGLLERLRRVPILDIESHRAPSGAQLIEHNAIIAEALSRLGVRSPVQEFGRRANNLNAWSRPLFEWLRASGFESLDDASRDAFVTSLQMPAAQRLTAINEEKPLIVRYSKGTSVAVIADILDQAQAKKKAKDVAEYLVGAKLQLRFGDEAVRPKHVNAASLANLADFRLGGTAIEVTTAPRADDSHTNQFRDIIRNTGLQVWVLVRRCDRATWQAGVDALFGADAARIVVADIETFVGQNVSEIAAFDAAQIRNTLKALFDKYEANWLPEFGAGGLRIADAETLPED